MAGRKPSPRDLSAAAWTPHTSLAAITAAGCLLAAAAPLPAQATQGVQATQAAQGAQGAQAAAAFSGPPSRAYSLARSQVPESFLAYLVGLIDADVQFTLDSQGLLATLPEFKGRTGDPFQLMREVARRQSAAGAMALSFRFPGDVRIPLPLGIFGYHPISVLVSRSIVLEERRFRSRSLADSAGAAVLAPDYEYRVSEGYARFQFDDWLTFLSGGALADFSVRGLAIFQDRGEWRALMAGTGQARPVVCWLFDLHRTSLIPRVPDALQGLAAELVP